MEAVFGIDQLLIRHVSNGSIGLLVAKVFDDFLLSGTEREITLLFGAIDELFMLGAISFGNKLKFLS